MSLDRDRFERLVRWYPRWWRDANAAVFVGTAMDAAEAGGLSAPSRGERMAAALAGLGPRLDATPARVAGAAALVLPAGEEPRPAVSAGRRVIGREAKDRTATRGSRVAADQKR